jgi:hypothetical protein
MDVNEKIFWEIDKLRRSNLNDEIPNVWEKIVSEEINTNNFRIEVNNDKYDVSFNGVKGKAGSFQKKCNSLCEKIFRLNAHEYNLKLKEDLKLENLKDFVETLLKTDKKIQLNYCTNPTRQSSHEKIEKSMLENGLDKKKWNIYHPDPGDKNIDGENIVPLSFHSRSRSRNARSIDIIIESIPKNNKITFYGFLKFSAASGGLQSRHQSHEAREWLKAAMEHVSTNNNKTYFFLISDGKEGERQLKIYKEDIRRFNDRIFVGNTDDIIKLIKTYE